MVEALGMQQVLQLTSTVERVQMAQQAQGAEQARGFDRELEKKVDHDRDLAKETQQTEEAKIRDEDQRKRKHYAMPRRQRPAEEAAKEEEAPKLSASESGEGSLINIVA